MNYYSKYSKLANLFTSWLTQDLSTKDMAKILENGEIVNDYAPGDIIDYDHEMSIPVKDTGIEYIIYQGTTPIKTCDTFQDAIKYVQEKL